MSFHTPEAEMAVSGVECFHMHFDLRLSKLIRGLIPGDSFTFRERHVNFASKLEVPCPWRERR
jgi:hypothetical protein